MFVGDGSEAVVDAASYMLIVDGYTYAALGVLFVLRGVLQGLGRTVAPTVTGVVELLMRVGAAIVLGSAFGFVGVVWSNPLAWFGAIALLVPAYVIEHRRLGKMRVQPLAPTPTTPIPIVGPVDGSMSVDAVVTGSIPVPDVSDAEQEQEQEQDLRRS